MGTCLISCRVADNMLRRQSDLDNGRKYEPGGKYFRQVSDLRKKYVSADLRHNLQSRAGSIRESDQQLRRKWRRVRRRV